MADTSVSGSSSGSHLNSPLVGTAPSPQLAVAAVLTTVRQVLRPLASLKLTVVLLVLSIAIVLIGTLAQVDMDMWEVMTKYFRAWIAWVEFRVLFPRTWFPGMQNLRGGFPFPGGASIGLAMAFNLMAAGVSAGIGWFLANVLRRRTRISVPRAMVGLAGLAIGAIATTLVILSGHNHDGLQGSAPSFLSWESLWTLFKIGLLAAFVASLGALATVWIRDRRRVAELILLATVSLSLGVPTVYLLWPGNEAYVGDSGMRILWQLILATGAALIVLVGCAPLFGRRAGVALLHSGVALMMFGQFFVGRYDVEEQMSIAEGATTNFAQDIRSVELAVIDRNDAGRPDEETVVAIPLYRTGGETRFLREKSVRHETLPFDLEIVEFQKNSDVRKAGPMEDKVATAGKGREFVASARRAGSGTDMSGGVDLASAYVRLKKKGGDQELGVYLLSQVALMMRDGKEFGFDEQVEVDGKKYDLSLRFQRNYKPYAMKLLDVRKDDYLGTNTPRNYSSDVHLTDVSRKVDREIHIWMNNPLRYAGETFYQSGYHQDAQGREHTTLQVVRNSGWMIPYVACMYVVVGMFAHFSLVLLRFLQQKASAGAASPLAKLVGWAIDAGDVATTADRAAPTPKSLDARGAGPSGKEKKRDRHAPHDVAAGSTAANDGRRDGLLWTLFPIAVVCLSAGWFASSARPPREPIMKLAAKTDGEAQRVEVHAFGRLPVIADGRVKPFDTLARNTLRVLCGREEFQDDSKKKKPAIVWLLDVISESPAAMDHKVFRIDNLEVLDTLGLTPRKGWLYSVSELLPKIGEFEKQVEQARQQDKDKKADGLSVYQRKLLEVDARIRTFTRLGAAFRIPNLPPLPNAEEFAQDRASAVKKMEAFRREYGAFTQSLSQAQIPLAVPMRTDEKKIEWQPYSKAWVAGYVDATMLSRKPDPAFGAFNAMLVHYAAGEAEKFNASVAEYRKTLERSPPDELVVRNSLTNSFIESRFETFYGFEAYFNHVAPFYYADVFYVAAFVLAAIAWLGFRRSMNSAAFWLLVFTLCLHTAALAARIYISGRPPVTNLYSSAVFIGWGCVVLGLLLEVVYGLGIGNVIAATTGFASLYIAHNLAADGDTFTVLQAVLDTQFWLATHVVSITFGYSTTFLAGFLGLLYVLRGVFTPTLTKEVGKDLTRMIYGTICFAMFFSFFGTVLGGLWADDSWGRFWGWDPKENGALIIVLWNAVLLHSRWSGLVQERGIAVLAILGNVVTAWSWFGVNELGVGLHAYGFTEGRLAMLGWFVLSQLALVGVGCLPRRLWWSRPATAA